MEYSEKQIKIMEVAEELFAEKGFAGTSVRDIAEAANINLAMVSYYFGSKEKLMEAMFQYRGHHMQMQLQTILKNDQLNSFQKIEKLIDDYVDRILKSSHFIKLW